VKRCITDRRQVGPEETTDPIPLVAAEASALCEQLTAALQRRGHRQALDVMAAQTIGLHHVPVQARLLPELDVVGMSVSLPGGPPLTVMANRAAHLPNIMFGQDVAGMRLDGLRLLFHAWILHADMAGDTTVGLAQVRKEQLATSDPVRLGVPSLLGSLGLLDQSISILNLVPSVWWRNRLMEGCKQQHADRQHARQEKSLSHFVIVPRLNFNG
jgi:hypothetical protein